MPFTLRIEIQGLFRFVTEGGDKPSKLTAVAPWVLPGKPPEWLGPVDSEIKPHQFVVSWQPRQLGRDEPVTARTLVPLTGQELTFEIVGGTPREGEGLDIPENLRIPRLISESSGKGLFEPNGSLGKAARIKPSLYKDRYLNPPEGKHGAANEEKVMGRVVIDRGRILTDEPVGVVSSFELPSGERFYRGEFTNRIAVVVEGVDSVILKARSLLMDEETGGDIVTMKGVELRQRQVPGVEAPTRSRGELPRLNISVFHFCSEFLLKKCSNPGVRQAQSREDVDFRWLYQLSEDPHKLRQLAGKALPAPKRYGRPHTCTQLECGCSDEPGGSS